MNTEITLHLSDTEPDPEFRVVSLTRNRQYIDIGKGLLTIHGTRRQVDAIVAQFQHEHAKRLTNALRLLLNMPDADDEEVQLAASVLLIEGRRSADAGIARAVSARS